MPIPAGSASMRHRFRMCSRRPVTSAGISVNGISLRPVIEGTATARTKPVGYKNGGDNSWVNVVGALGAPRRFFRVSYTQG